MKKQLLYISTILGLSVASVYAEDVVIKTNSAQLSGGEKDFEVYYAGPSTSSPTIGLAGETYDVGCITLKGAGLQVPGETEGVLSINPAKEWYFKGDYNFDIATESGKKTIIKNESLKRFYYQAGTLTVSNSATPSQEEGAVAPVAYFDLGSNSTSLMFNGSGQIINVNINTDTEFVTTAENGGGTKFPIYIYRNVAFNIDGSTVTFDANLRVGDGETTPTISLVNGSTMNIKRTLAFESGTLTVDETSKLVINKGSRFGVAGATSKATVNIAGTLDMNAVLTVNDSAVITTKKFEHQNGSDLTVSGEFETQSATTFANTIIKTGGIVKQTSTGGTKIARDFTVDGTFLTKGVLAVEAGSTDASDAKWATITINEGANFYVDGKSDAGSAITLKNGEFVLNKKNAITNSNGDAVQLVSVDKATNVIFRINESQEFKKIVAHTIGIKYYLGEDATDTLTAEFGSISGGKHIIYNFEENRVFVLNDMTNPNDFFDAYYNVDGEYVKVDNLYINNGWLSAINSAVPEPAEWAMILGALALGLAVYRKRK